MRFPTGKQIERCWLTAAIVAVVVSAVLIPDGGALFLEGGVVDAGVVVIMLLGGMKTPFERFAYLLSRPLIIGVALLSIFGLAPLTALSMGAVWGFSAAPDRLAVLILGAQATTLATAVVLTEVAGGDTALAIIITLASNLLSVVATPLVFGFFLGEAVEMDRGAMVRALLFKVTLPVVAGQLLRLPLKRVVTRYAKPMSVIAQLVILSILYSGLATGLERLVGGDMVVRIVLFVLVLHGVLLVLNAGIARLLSRDSGVRTAFVLTASQKTLPAAILIWKSQFASLPLGAVVAVSYHLIQLVTDSILAPGFRKLPGIRDRKRART